MKLEKAVYAVNHDDLAIYNGLYLKKIVMDGPFRLVEEMVQIDSSEGFDHVKSVVDNTKHLTGVFLAVNIGDSDRRVSVN